MAYRKALAVVFALVTAGCAAGPSPQPTAERPTAHVAVASATPEPTVLESSAPSSNPQTIVWGNCTEGCLQIAIDSFEFANDWGCSDIAAPVPSGHAILRLHVTVTASGSPSVMYGGFGFVGAYIKIDAKGSEIGPSFCDEPLHTPEIWGPLPLAPGQPAAGWLQFSVPAAGRLGILYGVSSGESNEVVLRP